MGIEQPIFLCGALRSGTTVLGLMLGHHHKIDNPGEFDFLFDKISKDQELPDSEYFINWLKLNRIFNDKNLTIDKTLSYKQLVNSFIQQLKNSDNYITCNVHRNFQHIPLIFPDAKYIHLMRDARDVARSSIGMGWFGNVYYGVDHWIDTENSWEKLVAQLRPEQYIETKFEEVISDPVFELNRICEFIGVKYSDEMLDYSKKSTYKKPDKKLTYQWKRKQTKREVQLVESKVRSKITDMGYQLSEYPSYTPGIVTRLYLFAQNKIFRIKNGINRYGLSLYLMEKVTRIPGIKLYRPKIIAQKNITDKSILK